MTFSIIIVTYNSSNVILSCLDSVYHMEGIVVPFEVIIVDNASSDGTVDVIRKKFPAAHLIENKDNIGFAAAVNRGAEAARGAYLVMLNPDTVVREGFLHGISEFFNRTSDAAIVGPKIVNDTGKHLPSCWYDPRLRTVFFEVFLPYRLALPLVTENPSTTKQVDMVSGACMAIRREVFQELKGFDTRFFMYYEDADFCLRARKKDHHVYYHPAVSIVHHAGGSTMDMSLFYQRVFKSKMLYLKKHCSAWYYAATYVIVLAGMIVRIFAYLVVGCVTFNRKLLRLAKYYTLALKKLLIGEFS